MKINENQWKLMKIGSYSRVHVSMTNANKFNARSGFPHTQICSYQTPRPFVSSIFGLNLFWLQLVSSINIWPVTLLTFKIVHRDCFMPGKFSPRSVAWPSTHGARRGASTIRWQWWCRLIGGHATQLRSCVHNDVEIRFSQPSAFRLSHDGCRDSGGRRGCGRCNDSRGSERNCSAARYIAVTCDIAPCQKKTL